MGAPVGTQYPVDSKENPFSMGDEEIKLLRISHDGKEMNIPVPKSILRERQAVDICRATGSEAVPHLDEDGSFDHYGCKLGSFCHKQKLNGEVKCTYWTNPESRDCVATGSFGYALGDEVYCSLDKYCPKKGSDDSCRRWKPDKLLEMRDAATAVS